MYGAILGDMIGSPYEFDRNNIKTKDFPLFCPKSRFTDDSVMTLAVAKALMDSYGDSEEKIRQELIRSMQKYGRLFPDAGYGQMFWYWLKEKNPKPYGSYGNGSAMRVSSVAWLYPEKLVKVRQIARLTAEVSHDHPEGIKGAESVAAAIWMAQKGYSKGEMKKYIENEFGYDFSRTCEQIREYYHHVETCQETVPEAITAFLEGQDFEDVIRTAVSLGGDCDTVTCIAGSIAEAFYGIDEDLKVKCRARLAPELLAVMEEFEGFIGDGIERNKF